MASLGSIKIVTPYCGRVVEKALLYYQAHHSDQFFFLFMTWMIGGGVDKSFQVSKRHVVRQAEIRLELGATPTNDILRGCNSRKDRDKQARLESGQARRQTAEYFAVLDVNFYVVINEFSLLE